jgi:hypothetical protein
LIFFLAAAARIAYVILGGEIQATAGLGAEMERAAAALATKGYLGDVFPGIEGPSAHVAPLYPALLAILYSLFGIGTFAAAIAQTAFAILVTASLCALLPYAARKLELGEGSGVLAGLFLAIAPLNLWVETSGSWEQPLASLTVLGLLLGFSKQSRTGWKIGPSLFFLGILFGLAGLLSPGLVPAGILIILGEFLSKKEHRSSIVRASLILALLGAVVTGPWILRNYRTFGAFIPIRGNLGLELALGNHDQANGKTFAIGWEDPADPIQRIHPFNSDSTRARLAEVGEVEFMKEKLHTSLEWIKEHPGRTAELTGRRFVLFWFPNPGMWSPSARARLLKSLLLSLVSATMFAGLILLWARNHPFRAHLLGAAFGPTLIHMVTHVYPRYGYPVLATSTLVGAYLVVEIWKKARARRRPPAGAD